MSDILELKGVYKRFGDKSVIDGLDMSVPENSVYGFIGKNGAGKTTVMRMILGLLKADGGEIFVCGERVRYGQTPTNRFVGYLPDVPAFYDYMTPREYLKLCGEITGLDKVSINSRTDELLELVGLSGENRKIGGFSRGMKQRLGIAQALYNRPKLMLCDEPTSALDPVGRKEILEILRRARQDTTVVFSTHILSDVERICDNIALLNDGRVTLRGSMDEIKANRRSDVLTLEFADSASVQRFLKSEQMSEYAKSAAADGLSVKVTGVDITRAKQHAIEAMYLNGIVPIKFETAEPTLENLFMEAVE